LAAELSGCELLTAGHAEAFLEECEAEGVRVLGIEALRIVEGATVPDMHRIAGFSGAPEHRDRKDAVAA